MTNGLDRRARHRIVELVAAEYAGRCAAVGAKLFPPPAQSAAAPTGSSGVESPDHVRRAPDAPRSAGIKKHRTEAIGPTQEGIRLGAATAVPVLRRCRRGTPGAGGSPAARRCFS
jgi:hypothetical protein